MKAKINNYPYVGQSVHPEINSALSETRGIIVFQEDLMAFYAKITGKTFAEADIARRAVAKYNPNKHETIEPFNQVREDIKNGLVNNFDFTEENALKVINHMLANAGYSFNKAHACAYSVNTFETLWWRKNYPTYFFTSLLNNNRNDPIKLEQFIYEIIKEGFTIHAPDINLSGDRFEADDSNIYLPLSFIKGIGTPEEIISKRPFHSAQDFIDRIDNRKINAANRAALFVVGALDRIDDQWYNWNITGENLLAINGGVGLFKKAAQELFPNGKKSSFYKELTGVLSGVLNLKEVSEEFKSWFDETKNRSKLKQAVSQVAEKFINFDYLEDIHGLFSPFKDQRTRQTFSYGFFIPDKDFINKIERFNNTEQLFAGKINKIYTNPDSKTIEFYDNTRLYIRSFIDSYHLVGTEFKEGDFVLVERYYSKKFGSYTKSINRIKHL